MSCGRKGERIRLSSPHLAIGITAHADGKIGDPLPGMFAQDPGPGMAERAVVGSQAGRMAALSGIDHFVIDREIIRFTVFGRVPGAGGVTGLAVRPKQAQVVG